MRIPHKLLQRWALRIMRSRSPDFIVGTEADPYMLRWYAIPRNKLFNIYLHEFVRSNDPRALHDHPWVNLSIIVQGCYVEHTIAAGGIHRRIEYSAGTLRLRSPFFAHRVEIAPGTRPRTIFITGPVLRQWGFHCRLGWRSFKDFVRIVPGPDGSRVSQIGEGCGELD